MKEIQLTQGKVALVDDEDYEYLSQWKWCAHISRYTKTFYAMRNEKCKSVLMHRVIMNTPKGLLVDHVNHDTLDNRKSNLRNATVSQNGMNRYKTSNNTSGHVGVHFDARRQKFAASIKKNTKLMFLGYFQKIEDAILKRKEAEKQYFGEYGINR